MAAWKRAWPCGLPSLLGLAPGGVCPAAAVAGSAVRSYRTISPLPPAAAEAEPVWRYVSVALSLGSPPPGVTRHRASLEPGLSSPALRQRRSSGRLAKASRQVKVPESKSRDFLSSRSRMLGPFVGRQMVKEK